MGLKTPVLTTLLKKLTFHLWKLSKKKWWRNWASWRTGGTGLPTGTDVGHWDISVPFGVSCSVLSGVCLQVTSEWTLQLLQIICERYAKVKVDLHPKCLHYFVFVLLFWRNIKSEFYSVLEWKTKQVFSVTKCTTRGVNECFLAEKPCSYKPTGLRNYFSWVEFSAA